MKSLYNKPIVCSPIGKSDHNTVYWPSLSKIRSVGKIQKKSVRPLLKPKMHEFGRWITTHKWDEVLNGPNTVDKAESFYSTIHEAIDMHFPTKVVRLHTTDKPWITPEIKLLITKRQKAFAEKKMYTCGAFCAIKLLA